MKRPMVADRICDLTASDMQKGPQRKAGKGAWRRGHGCVRLQLSQAAQKQDRLGRVVSMVAGIMRIRRAPLMAWRLRMARRWMRQTCLMRALLRVLCFLISVRCQLVQKDKSGTWERVMGAKERRKTMERAASLAQQQSNEIVQLGKDLKQSGARQKEPASAAQSSHRSCDCSVQRKQLAFQSGRASWVRSLPRRRKK
eukprot:6211987-Pleurochrysis_carterae.AAC.7